MLHTDTLVEYVRTATADVFTTMLDLALEHQPGHVDGQDPAISDGVLGFIGMAGPWAGAGVITCSAAFACQICSHLLMTETDSVNEEVLDAVGEVTNMIIGGFKTLVEQETGPLGLSIPTVIFGRNFRSRSTGHQDWTVVPFQCGQEIVEVRVCLSPAANTPPRHGFSHSMLMA